MPAPFEPAQDIRWDADGLVPAIVQDAQSGRVLMLAYMNQEALSQTLQSGETWFWSRSRDQLWHKGATSGNTQRVVDLRYDCDADALLVRVVPRGPACHTGHGTCFYRRLAGSHDVESHPDAVLPHLWEIIQQRKANPSENSYTSRLLAAGDSELVKKVGEEAIEVVVAAQSEGGERLVSELADFVYHSLVLLASRDLTWRDVEAELASRFPQGDVQDAA